MISSDLWMNIVGLCAAIVSVISIYNFKFESLVRQSEIERLEMEQRMNDYPPKFFRLANILEFRTESRLFFRLEENFFKIFDINYHYYFFAPVLVVGLFELIKKRHIFFLIMALVIPLAALTITGGIGFWDKTSLYPFIITTAFYGVFNSLEK